MKRFKVKNLGVGMGLRVENSEDLVKHQPEDLDCLEVAPENFYNTGGTRYREFRKLAERYPIVFHGISLSIGSLKPLNKDYLKVVKKFTREYKTEWFSDHLCYSSVMGAQFHDLLPLPFTREAVEHVVPRIKEVQEVLEMPLAIENVSCYIHPGDPEMKEWEFLREVVERSDCAMLLDVNNLYVNSVNFGFDPEEYLKDLPYERILQIHVAGHKSMGDYLLDTHGTPVIDPVWDILAKVAARTDLPCVILERDHNLPSLEVQLEEVRHARRILREAAEKPKKVSGGAK